MFKRKPTIHLLLAVSFLLLIFLVAGYTLRKRGESVGLTPETPVQSASSLSPVTEPPSGTGLLRPDVGDDPDDDLAGWVPSVGMDSLDGGNDSSEWLDPFQDAIPHSGAITGLVPSALDGDALSSTRPPSSFSEPVAESGGSLSVPADLMGGGDAADDDSSFLASLPVPGGGSSLPPATRPTSSMRPPASGSGGDELLMPPVEASSLPPPPLASPPGGSMRPSGEYGVSGGSSFAATTDDDDEDVEYLEDEWEYEDETAVGTAPPLRANVPPPPPPPTGQPRNVGVQSTSESLRIYVVRSGDSLSSIAARELGSSSFADNIFLLNRDVIDDPDHLLVGVRIRLPVSNTPDYAANGTLGGGDAPARRNQGLGRTHIVVRGDTLSSIAQQYYGSSVGWRFLYDNNRHLLSNPNQLVVGMELTIPPYEQ